jgi:hypothetical protein
MKATPLHVVNNPCLHAGPDRMLYYTAIRHIRVLGIECSATETAALLAARVLPFRSISHLPPSAQHAHTQHHLCGTTSVVCSARSPSHRLPRDTSSFPCSANSNACMSADLGAPPPLRTPERSCTASQQASACPDMQVHDFPGALQDCSSTSLPLHWERFSPRSIYWTMPASPGASCGHQSIEVVQSRAATGATEVCMMAPLCVDMVHVDSGEEGDGAAQGAWGTKEWLGDGIRREPVRGMQRAIVAVGELDAKSDCAGACGVSLRGNWGREGWRLMQQPRLWSQSRPKQPHLWSRALARAIEAGPCAQPNSPCMKSDRHGMASRSPTESSALEMPKPGVSECSTAPDCRLAMMGPGLAAEQWVPTHKQQRKLTRLLWSQQYVEGGGLAFVVKHVRCNILHDLRQPPSTSGSPCWHVFGCRAAHTGLANQHLGIADLVGPAQSPYVDVPAI